MTKAGSHALVIDASVIRAAGETEHPVSSACRAYLEGVLSICHRAVLTSELREEWNSHQSKFARKWRRSMAARRKLLNDIESVPVDLDLTSFPPQERGAIKKDVFLLGASLAADKILVTRDDKLFKSLGATPKGLRLRAQITWHNPTRDAVDSLP